MADFIAEVIRGLNAGGVVAVATVIGPPAADTSVLGRKLVVTQDGEILGTLGSASIDRQIANNLMSTMGEATTPHLIPYPLSPKEQARLNVAVPELELFLEFLVPAPTLLIAGGGHIAVPLCTMGKSLGFRVAVVDDRPDFANRERFPDADQVIAGDFGEVLAGRIPVNSSSYVVIVTRGHANDEAALRAVLESHAAYIGMIGSSKKVKTIMDRMRESGVPQKQLDQVYSPIGLDIAAETPAEIALSILAEIVHLRRCGTPHPSSMKLATRQAR